MGMISVGFGRFGIAGIGGIVGFGVGHDKKDGNVGFGRVGILGIGGIVGFGNGGKEGNDDNFGLAM